MIQADQAEPSSELRVSNASPVPLGVVACQLRAPQVVTAPASFGQDR